MQTGEEGGLGPAALIEMAQPGNEPRQQSGHARGSSGRSAAVGGRLLGVLCHGNASCLGCRRAALRPAWRRALRPRCRPAATGAAFLDVRRFLRGAVAARLLLEDFQRVDGVLRLRQVRFRLSPQRIGQQAQGDGRLEIKRVGQEREAGLGRGLCAVGPAGCGCCCAAVALAAARTPSPRRPGSSSLRRR